MPLKEPKSMDECVYFTNRILDNDGYIKAWVFRGLCEKCSKGLMGKPKNPKTGKAKIRASEFVCPECNFTLDETTYEEKLTINVKYKCSYCKNESELQLPFKRKKAQRFNEESQKKETVECIAFPCSKCGKNIYITKKMK